MPKYASVEEFAGKLNPGEPYFLVRAQDMLSIITLARYAAALAQVGLLAQRQEIEALTVAFAEWQSEHPELVKLPD